MTRIGVSTGCLYQLDLSLPEQVELIRDLDVDGIEVSFTDWAEVASTDPAALGDLGDEFGFVKVHAPIRDEVTEEHYADVAALERMREYVGADVIVYHPPKLPSLQAVTERSSVAIENMQRRKGFDTADLASFIDGWDGPLVLDVCHAATWGMETVEELFERYGDRCSHVHLSALGEKEHERLVEHPSFMDTVAELVAGHDIILENRAGSRAALAEEVAFVRERLDGL